MRIDCVARVVPAGPSFHTGGLSCFCTGALAADTLGELDATIADRADTPSGADRPSYTRRLLADRNLRLKKLGEESAELIAACADGDAARAAAEAADVVYHVLVALRAFGVALDDGRHALADRAEARTARTP